MGRAAIGAGFQGYNTHWSWGVVVNDPLTPLATPFAMT